jgi:hypothetical protein
LLLLLLILLNIIPATGIPEDPFVNPGVGNRFDLGLNFVPAITDSQTEILEPGTQLGLTARFVQAFFGVADAVKNSLVWLGVGVF